MSTLSTIADQINEARFNLVNLNREKLGRNEIAFEIINLLNEIDSKFDKLTDDLFQKNPLTINHYDKLNSEIVLNEPWEIDADIYNHFLNILPPLEFASDKFILCEFKKGNITTEYFKSCGKYFCRFIEYKKRSA